MDDAFHLTVGPLNTTEMRACFNTSWAYTAPFGNGAESSRQLLYHYFRCQFSSIGCITQPAPCL